MQLKKYQLRALDQLQFFLEECRFGDFSKAFKKTIERAVKKQDSAAVYAKGGYAPVEGLEETVPYCCIRLPTGGGKTILAAHALKIAADAYLERPNIPVIWLVPSSKIQSQTIDALKRERHPYREAITESFGKPPKVFDIGERRQIRPTDLAESTVIVVATYQAFRVEDTSIRGVYATDENLEPHFKHATPGMGLEIEEDGPFKGQIALSFANLLYMHRPLMILDEAHNFMTGLSGDVKQRLNPSAIIEFTATPKAKSNIVSAATAEELKNADMIKMPIHLQEHDSPERAIASTVQNRAKLAQIAEDAGESIRPIALYQAQPATKTAQWPVNAVKKHLVENERIPEEAIVIATGDQRGLDGQDLFDPKSKIEHIITQQALKEGWDCSFAYVFCSLASLSSKGAVEQILGRVLRMPWATRRTSEELNRAYAHVSEGSFFAAAQGLQDRLVSMGFDEVEARKAIIEMPEEFTFDDLGDGPMFERPDPPLLTLQERPNTSDWSPEAQQAVKMVANEEGGIALTVADDAPEEVQREIAKAVEYIAPGSTEAIERYIAKKAEALSPAERGMLFNVPQFHLQTDGEPELVFPETFIEIAGWNLLDHPAKLPGFSVKTNEEVYEFDIDGDELVYQKLEEQIEFAMDDQTDWDEAALARFLDRETHQRHTGQKAYLEWCRKLVRDLVEKRGIEFKALVRGKYALKRAVIKRVQNLREKTGRKGVQMVLAGMDDLIAPEDRLFQFTPGAYHPPSFYAGRWRPKKHFYARMGELDNKEELAGAQAIDGLDEVKYWVRNIPRTPNSYWLPTATDKFYPDFVAQLEDGRQLIVEHKGQESRDAEEKENLGLQLEETSKGKVLFIMTWGQDVSGQLRQKLEPKT